MPNQQSYTDEFRPLPVVTPEVAKVSVGFSKKGHLAVRVLITSHVDLMPGLKETFDRAAAAFMKEFGRDEKLMAIVKSANKNNSISAVEQATQEVAQRDGAVQVGYDKDVS